MADFIKPIIRAWKGSQTIHFEGHFQSGEKVIRVRIVSDSVTEQGYGRLDVWSKAEDRWTEVAKLSGHELACNKFSAYGREPITPAMFDKDLDSLMAVWNMVS